MADDTDLCQSATDAHAEGALAFKAGEPVEANPYHHTTDFARAWASGHYNASPANRAETDANIWFDETLATLDSAARNKRFKRDFGGSMRAHAIAADICAWAMKAEAGRVAWTYAKERALEIIVPFIPATPIEHVAKLLPFKGRAAPVPSPATEREGT